MDLTSQDKILLEEDKVSANQIIQITKIFGSLCCPIEVLPSQSLSSNIPFVKEGIEKSTNQNDDEGWTLIT